MNPGIPPERPEPAEYAPFYAGYVSLVPEPDVFHVLEDQPAEVRRHAAAIPLDREAFRYAPDKWSVRQVFGHLADGERVFGYRAFCISRGERASLPGMDEKEYVAGSRFDEAGLAELAQEFVLLREANLTLLRRLDAASWGRVGTANGVPVSVRALAYIMAGHVRHHLGVLRARYGLQPGS